MSKPKAVSCCLGLHPTSLLPYSIHACHACRQLLSYTYEGYVRVLHAGRSQTWKGSYLLVRPDFRLLSLPARMTPPLSVLTPQPHPVRTHTHTYTHRYRHNQGYRYRECAQEVGQLPFCAATPASPGAHTRMHMETHAHIYRHTRCGTHTDTHREAFTCLLMFVIMLVMSCWVNSWSLSSSQRYTHTHTHTNKRTHTHLHTVTPSHTYIGP